MYESLIFNRYCCIIYLQILRNHLTEWLSCRQMNIIRNVKLEGNVIIFCLDLFFSLFSLSLSFLSFSLFSLFLFLSFSHTHSFNISLWLKTNEYYQECQARGKCHNFLFGSLFLFFLFFSVYLCLSVSLFPFSLSD